MYPNFSSSSLFIFKRLLHQFKTQCTISINLKCTQTDNDDEDDYDDGRPRESKDSRSFPYLFFLEQEFKVGILGALLVKVKRI